MLAAQNDFELMTDQSGAGTILASRETSKRTTVQQFLNSKLKSQLYQNSTVLKPGNISYANERRRGTISQEYSP